MDAAGRVGHAARHISKSSSNAREGQSNCQASHETKKDAQFQDSHYLDSLLTIVRSEERAPRDTRDSLIQFLEISRPNRDPRATSAIKFGVKVKV
jgi:hypothetical protein